MARKSKSEIIVSSFAQLKQSELGVYEVPEGTTTIRVEWEGIPLFKKLVIPASVTHMEGLVHIANCLAIEVHPDNPAYCSVGGVVYTKDQKMLVACPQAIAPLAYTYHVLVGTQAIAEYAFADNRTLESIILPAGLTDIGDCAFSSCTSLLAVHIPDTVANIGMYCFIDSTRINRLYFPSSVNPLYTSNLSSGIVIEIADEVPLNYDAIPTGIPLYDAFSYGTHPHFKPLLLCHNNPDVVAFAESADYRCIQDYYVDNDKIIWSGHDLLCFPDAWPHDQYTLPIKTERVYAGAFAATRASYLLAHKEITFFPLFSSALFATPSTKGKWAYKLHPGKLPKNDFLPNDDPIFFVSATGISYNTIMGTDDSDNWYYDDENP